jgi:hypothetical protein
MGHTFAHMLLWNTRSSKKFPHQRNSLTQRIGDQSERLQRLVELNVYEQCLNLYRNPIIQVSGSLTFSYVDSFWFRV